MRTSLWLLLSVMLLPTTARAQHTKRDATELSAKLDAILRDAYKTKPAPRAHRNALVDGGVAKKLEAPPPPSPPPPPSQVERAHVDNEEGSFAGVLVHALRIAFDPDAWSVHLAPLPKTPEEVAVHVQRLPKTPTEIAAHLALVPQTPDEVAAHLRNLPKSPAEVNAHLRRLDTALHEPHRHHRQQQ